MRTDMDLQIDQIRASLIEMGERADGMMAAALRALADADPSAADLVVDTDQHLDRAYEQTQHGVLAVVALHGPVGRDLRMLISFIHVSLHLERMGDYAVNVANTAKRALAFRSDPQIVDQLVRMGESARHVTRTALQAFVDQDTGLAHEVSGLDDDVDRLNIAIFHRLVRLASQDDDHLEWATRMIQLSRQVERFADHGVDIAEQAIFVATGESVELSSNDPR